MSDWYDVSGSPATSSQGASATIRAEFSLIESAMAKLPALTGNGDEVLKVNAGGTSVETVTSLAVPQGGTGVATLTDGGILLGSGVGAVTAMAVLADGEIVIGDGTTDPVPLAAFSSATGTLNVANGGTGVATLTDGGILLGSGTSGITAMSVLADGEMIVGDGTTDPVAESGATLRTSIGVAIGSDVQAWSSVLDATTASFLIADETKLDGIEALADVTDTANVTAAGALMDSEVNANLKTFVLPASTTISAFGATLVDDVAAGNARTTLGLVIGTDVQAYDADIPTEPASQAEMEAGTETAVRAMSPLRVKQAIDELALTVGSIQEYGANTPPTGYLECDGSSLNTTTYADLFAVLGYTFGGSGASFNIPDMRGEFPRGWDNGRGKDSGRAFGSTQVDQANSIKDYHATTGQGSATGTFTPDDAGAYTSYFCTGRNDGGNRNGRIRKLGVETRPDNVALMFIIKF